MAAEEFLVRIQVSIDGRLSLTTPLAFVFIREVFLQNQNVEHAT